MNVASATISQMGQRFAPWIATGLLMATAIGFSPNFSVVSGPQAGPFAGDFLQEWIGGYLIHHGNREQFYQPGYATRFEHTTDLVGFDWDESQYFPMVYPPFYYWALSPLSSLPFTAATVVWLELLTLALIVAWRIFASTWGRTRTAVVAWLLPLSLLFTPVIESLTSCQKGTVLLLLFTGTLALLERGKTFTAGMLFGLLAFKPQLAIPLFVAMLLKRQGRFIVGTLVTGIALGGVSLLLGGNLVGQYIDFMRHASDYISSQGYDLTKSHTWYGFFTQITGGPTTLARIATATSILTTYGFIAWRGRIADRPGTASFRRWYVALLIATVIGSPHCYTYDLTILLLPLGLAMVSTRDEVSPSVQVGGLMLFCLAGIAPKLAATTGIQFSVPLLAAWLGCWLASPVAASIRVNLPVSLVGATNTCGNRH